MRFFYIILFAITPLWGPKDPTDADVKAAYQALPMVDGHYEFSEVVQVDSSLKKDDLYKNAKLFFANEFKSAKDVLQYDDRGEGRVVGKGNLQLNDDQYVFLVLVSDKRIVNFSIEIFCKDGRYRYRLYDLAISDFQRSHSSSGADGIINTDGTFDIGYAACLKGTTKKMYRRLFIASIDNVKATIGDLKKAMAGKASNENF